MIVDFNVIKNLKKSLFNLKNLKFKIESNTD